MAMQIYLRLFLFSTLVTAGVSLQCETCSEVATGCTGKMETCPVGQDTCSVGLVENRLLGEMDPSSSIPGILLSTPNPSLVNPGILQNPELPPRIDESSQMLPGQPVGGGTILSIQKGCEPLRFCKYGDLYMNSGRNRSLRGSNTCCKGAACQKVPLKLPPMLTKPNGRQCPACFAVSRPCPDETVQCLGPEVHCFETKLTAKFGPLGILIAKATAKGCASKSFCELSKTSSKMYGRLGFHVEEVRCDTISKAPGSFGSHFLVLSSLLLMMFLL